MNNQPQKSPGNMCSLPEPCEREQRAITEANTRRIARRPRLAASVVKQDGTMAFGAGHTDLEWCDQARDAFGTPSGDFAMTELGRISAVLGGRDAVPEAVLNAALAVVDGQRRKDEIEAQLIAQMAVTHAVAMDFLGRSKRAEFIDQLEAFGKLANRLLRTYTMQCDTLTSLRRGGRQVVEVQHVYRPRRKREGVDEKKPLSSRNPNGRRKPVT